MNNETDNLVLEHLRRIRDDLSMLKDDMHDLKSRMSAVEVSTGQIITMIGGLNQ